MNGTETQAETSASWAGQTAQLFRTEALAYYSQGQGSDGDLLRLAPTWTRWTYWLLLAVAVASLLGAWLCTLDQYTSGPAFVQIQAGQPSPRLIAFLPGQQRPLLHIGQPLRLTLTGYQTTAQSARIEALRDPLLTPAQVRQRFGASVAMSLGSGPVVMVQAHMPAPTFTVDAQTLSYVDGMQGRVETPVRSERLLLTLFPMLKGLLGGRENEDK